MIPHWCNDVSLSRQEREGGGEREWGLDRR
jgi:hypothetical protein